MGKGEYPPLMFSPEKHPSYIQQIFSGIAGRYDFMNRILSLGIDVLWRRFAVSQLCFSRTFRLLDVASGTADVAIMAAKRFPGIVVFGVDTVGEMLEVGISKVKEKKLESRIFFIRGDALNLPFARESFDVAAIAFGIRNIINPRRVIEEMVRVVVPGGQVLVLEMHMPKHPLVSWFFRFYSRTFVPLMANLFSPEPEAYKYLLESIERFHTPDQLSLMMEEEGLGRVVQYPLTFGFACLHVGWKV